jgi:hypothetical protein
LRDELNTNVVDVGSAIRRGGIWADDDGAAIVWKEEGRRRRW